MKEKKRKNPLENLESFETRKRENVTTQAIENASNDKDKAIDNDEEIKEIAPFPVFVFNATKKNVKVESKTRVKKATKSRSKGTTSHQRNIFSYFTTSRGSHSDQTGFKADHI